MAKDKYNRETEAVNEVEEAIANGEVIAEATAGESETSLPEVVEAAGAEESVSGRAVFAVSLVGQSVGIETAFLAEDGRVLRLPAVFPNRLYAMAQIDELRAIVNRHFDDLDRSIQ